MRMLFISEKFPPSEGGSRVYYYNLCNNYSSGDVVVLTKKVPGYEEFDKRQRLKIVRKNEPLPNWKYQQVPRLIPTLFWTIYLTLKERIDVIHCGDFFPSGVIGLLMKILFRMPYVYYVHGEGNTWFRQFRFQPRVRKIILENADCIVAACTYAEDGVRRDINNTFDKVVKITPGVAYEKFDPSFRDYELLRELGISGKRIILTIGRLVERKGQDTVIRALPDIVAEIPNVIYLIAGRGPYEDKLRSLADELRVTDHVRFLGYLSDDKIASYYSICDIFVMINRETIQDGPEGFGMVFTEASAAGRPVVGGRSGGTEDSILDGVSGYRVDPLDLGAVSDAIIRILADDDLRFALGRHGREWVIKNFAWHDRAQKLEMLNQEIMDMKK